MTPIDGKLYSPFLKETQRLVQLPGPGHNWDFEKVSNWERRDATVSRIRITEGFPINSFRELVEEVAKVTLNNRNYEMFYRGQTHDYKDSQGAFYKDKKPKTVIYPAICRPERKDDGTYKHSIRKDLIISRYENLRKFDVFFFNHKYGLQEYALSLFQHYDILPTPLIDITQSLRVAATFALRKSLTGTGYLYVFGLPYPNGSISHFVDQGITLIKLQNVSPPNAYRPRYQEGYLVGKYPIRPTKEAGDNLARRLIAKFLLENKNNKFWDNKFTPMPEEVLFPQDDTFERQLNALKEEFLKQSQKKSS